MNGKKKSIKLITQTRFKIKKHALNIQDPSSKSEDASLINDHRLERILALKSDGPLSTRNLVTM